MLILNGEVYGRSKYFFTLLNFRILRAHTMYVHRHTQKSIAHVDYMQFTHIGNATSAVAKIR